MEWQDYLVLVVYFLVMATIGVLSMLRIKRQEDYFMGGRTFGKLLQTFAAFGAGTGSSDPINTARTTFTSGLSGMWSIMSWLFVTPFYWIAGVWYRRMRLLTLGDWFVERYESKGLGVAYTIFGLLFFILYMAMLFTAIAKYAAPMIGGDEVVLAGTAVKMEYVLVPIIAVIVIVYGVLGGLTAAYWTDLIQGLCIIALSVLLIPFGLSALVEKFGDPASQGLFDGFRIMHERLPDAMFTIVGTTRASEFPIHYVAIVALTLLLGAVVMPHFIATGGGSAKSETNARVGLVTGNFFKRFCTIGWALTALIVLALMADNPVLKADPDKVWGVASLELFGAGLRGLMLACLLAALMSSVDCYMLVCSALVVRNVYAAYVKEDASEKEYITLARITGAVIIAGTVLMSWVQMNVFKQLQLTWIFPTLVAAPFWVGMYWRRATRVAAWWTVGFSATVFFILPLLLPVVVPGLRDRPGLLAANQIVRTTVTRQAVAIDVAGREAEIAVWHDKVREWVENEGPQSEQSAIEKFGPCPEPLQQRDMVSNEETTGGTAVFWSGGVKPVDADGEPVNNVKPQPAGPPRQVDESTTEVVLQYPEGTRLRGFGMFKLDFLVYRLFGMDFTTKSNAMFATLDFPVKIVAPFVLMILLSLITRRNSKEVLDRLYVRMKTPVDPDPEIDKREVEKSYADPSRFDHRKLLPGTDFEAQRPTVTDAAGFITCFVVCFLIILLAIGVAMIGR